MKAKRRKAAKAKWLVIVGYSDETTEVSAHSSYEQALRHFTVVQLVANRKESGQGIVMWELADATGRILLSSVYEQPGRTDVLAPGRYRYDEATETCVPA